MTLLSSTSAHNNKSFTPGVPSHHATTSQRNPDRGERKEGKREVNKEKGGKEKSVERKKKVKRKVEKEKRRE
jgi:hypothetical protein